MLDADGYPTDEVLEKIAHYDVVHQPLSGFIALIRENWRASD